MSSISFYPCHCENQNGFGSCPCLPEKAKKNEWSFHQKKYCNSKTHKKFKQNGYFILKTYHYCKIKKSERFEITKNKNHFPCTNESHWMGCTCIINHTKLLTSQYTFYATHTHNQYFECQNVKHDGWYKKHHYKVPIRPVWPWLCHQPLKGHFTSQVKKLCVVFHLYCECSQKVCTLCWRIAHNDSLTFPKNGVMNLVHLSKLFPFIKWNKISLNTVTFQPLYNQDGSKYYERL